MGRAGITYSEITKAANELIEAGTTPTIEKIRAKIGTGSYTTIAALLKKWKEHHPTEHLSKTEGIPPTLIATIKELWLQLTEQANQRCQEMQDTASQHIEAEKQLRLTAEQNMAKFKKDNDALQDQLEQHSKLATTLQTQLTQAQQTVNEHAVTIQHLQETISTHISENKRLYALTQQLHKNLEHFQATTAQQRQQEQLQLREEKSKLEHQIKSLTDQLYKNRHAYDQEVRNNSALLEQFKTTEQQIDLQKKEINNHQNNQNELQQQLHSLTSKNKTLNALLDREKIHSKTLQRRYDSLLKSMTHFKKQRSEKPKKTPA